MSAEHQQLWDKKYLKFSDIVLDDALMNISVAINSQNARQILYHALNKLFDVPKCLCGSALSWHNDERKYRVFCSKKCTAMFTVDSRKKTSLEKYGVDHHSKTPEFSKKIKNTSLAKFGVEHYSKTEDFKQSVKTTSQQKYGTDHPMQNQSILDQTKEKWIQTLGVDNPAQLDSVKEKIKKTNIEKYGVACVLSNSDIRERIKDTNVAKYGFASPSQNPDILERIVKTRREQYYDPSTLEFLKDPQWLAEQNSSGLTISTIASKLGISASNLGKIYARHGIEIKRHFASSYEKVLTDWLDEHNVDYQINVRNIIYPFELDIFIPSVSLAIEVNGGYWHHEDQGKHREYHLSKTQKCTEKNIELWHFFDWEMDIRLEIVLSKIAHKLGLSKRIYARTLQIIELNAHDKHVFVDNNHLQGDCSSKINLGLTDKTGIIYAAMTFGKSRFNKNYNWELLRFCNRTGFSVVGGAQRLLTKFLNAYKSENDSLISYCNLRFSIGNLYETLGFRHLHDSPPNYMYVTHNGNYAGTRNQWQKHLLYSKLPNFNKLLSEYENMKLNGYHRIWDCGQRVYEYNLLKAKPGHVDD
jgi:hypothetical protein